MHVVDQKDDDQADAPTVTPTSPAQQGLLSPLTSKTGWKKACAVWCLADAANYRRWTAVGRQLNLGTLKRRDQRRRRRARKDAEALP